MILNVGFLILDHVINFLFIRQFKKLGTSQHRTIPVMFPPFFQFYYEVVLVPVATILSKSDGKFLLFIYFLNSPFLAVYQGAI